jgi:hypothetical protein
MTPGLEKIHSLVLEVNPQDTPTIGAPKYAPQLHLSKDVAVAYVIGRRALGFEEKLPKGYEALLRDDAFLAHVQALQRPPPRTPSSRGRRRTPPQAEAFPL